MSRDPEGIQGSLWLAVLGPDPWVGPELPLGSGQAGNRPFPPRDLSSDLAPPPSLQIG